MSSTTAINYSKTQRIVLLIDLHPFFHLQNPNSYLKSLLTSIKILLSFPPLSLSLSSFKLFFSSLSPHLSYSTLLKLSISSYNPNSLSFNLPSETLASITETLNLVSNSVDLSGSGSGPKGSHASSSILQVIHDYAWDLSVEFNSDDSDLLGIVRSNLVVVFSPVCRSLKDLSQFLDFDEVLSDSDAIFDKFRAVFGHVKDAFVSRDIHFSWVDVRYDYDIENDNKSGNLDECSKVMELFHNGFNKLGWSFCPSDSIVLGSALVPFGLIYPKIGVSSTYCKSSDTCKKFSGQLNLEILDVSGKPMECKYCDIQLLDLKLSRKHRLNDLSLTENNGGVGISQQFSGIWESFGDGVVKIEVKALRKHSDLVKIGEQISDVLLVDELSMASKKKIKEPSEEFFADRVLDLLSEETDKSMKRNLPPLWQILLSFLYREGYWAVLNLSNANGSTTTGVLKPFTVHLAFLFILKLDIDSLCGAQNSENGLNLGQGSSERKDKVACFDLNMDPVSETPINESRRKHRKPPHRHKDLSWRSFCKAAHQLCEVELEGAYFSKRFESSKKLKFLKCWMKQVTKCNSSLPYKSGTPKSLEKTGDDIGQVHQENQHGFPSLAGVHTIDEPSQLEDAEALEEAFFKNLSQRIQHGIVTGVELVNFSQRVVSSCIYWLRRKLGPDNKEESLASLEKSDGNSYEGLVAGELVKILLIDPKDKAGKHKDGILSSQPQEAQSSKLSSEDRVREYELQILFRMEILQSDIAAGIRDSTKHKFVKQICCFLELIQCSMEDGFFGDFNFNDYVGRTIKSRYSRNLGNVVHRIYDQMDLLLFDDDVDESPNPLLNSEDSSQSWKVGDNRGSEPNSTDDSFHSDSADHDRKLAEAQERRARASRFASSTRRAMPELQRVWAPKPPKVSRSKSDSFRGSKRKGRLREKYDIVCETPISVTKKCLFPSESVGHEERREQGGSSTGFAHRALFQDESWHDDWGL